MFTKSAAFYDAIYSFKNYEKEVARLRELIDAHKRSQGRRLLDVACGTGTHLGFLRRDFEVEGLDLDKQMLGIASSRLPGVSFHHGDMLDFDLGRRFDVVLCLFSSIGYLKGTAALEAAVCNFTRHLAPGGLLIVEPWITPENFNRGTIHGLFVDRPDLKIARMVRSEVVDRRSTFQFHYLVATPGGIDYFTENHDLFLFRKNEYVEAFEAAGLDTSWDDTGLMGRGLVIGNKAQDSK